MRALGVRSLHVCPFDASCNFMIKFASMTFEPREISTTIATLKRVRHDLLEIHYHPGCVFSPVQVKEVQDARRTVMGGVPYATLTIIPEDADFQLETMRMDHAASDRTNSQVIATAIVVRTNMIERLIHVYFNYYPQLQRILVTDKEDEARAWMSQQLDEISDTGS